MFKFRVNEASDDLPQDILIAVVQSPEGMAMEQAVEVMKDAWEDFRESEPEADSDFGKWLVEHHGFAEIEDDFNEFTVNG